jgi:predicted small metal-binding protein
MHFRAKCEEAGTDCKHEITGETKEQVLEEVSSHLSDNHPDLAVSMEQLEALIHTNR